MQDIRKILAGVACGFLPITLFMFGSFFSVNQSLGNPDTVKQALDKSGIYEVFVAGAIDKIRTDQPTAAIGEIPIGTPAVKTVIEKAVPPEYIQQHSEDSIDTTYAWLRGETPDLNLNIDLRDAKTNIANGLGDYALQRLNTLPTCTSISELSTQVNPIEATCLPPNFDKGVAAAKVRDDVLSSQDFLKDPIIKVNSNGTSNDQNVQLNNFKIATNVYEQNKWGMYISEVASVILAAMIIFWSATKRAGIKRLAIITTIVGALSAGLALIASLMMNSLTTKISGSEVSNQLQLHVVEAVRLITQDLRNWWLGYGLGLLGLGLILFIVVALTKSKHHQNSQPLYDNKVPVDLPPPVSHSHKSDLPHIKQ